jgi:hypothetical protein
MELGSGAAKMSLPGGRFKNAKLVERGATKHFDFLIE